MDIWFDPARELGRTVREAASRLPDFGADFAAEIRSADPRFGDFQANGVLPFARKNKLNPRELAGQLAAALRGVGELDPALVKAEIAGPGFINFRFTPRFLLAWLQKHKTEPALQAAAGDIRKGRRIVVDFSSPNAAKEMHVGHIRSMVIGEAVCRLLEFCGASVIRDNHLGDWGTQFGILLWAVKRQQLDLDAIPENPLAVIENLYKEGAALTENDPGALAEARSELVKLQRGDPENRALWEKINRISYTSFQEIYDRMGVRFDEVLGESFYFDKLESLYRELEETGLAREDQGALVVFHPEHPRFKKQPFIIRKSDGASNYAATDLAAVLYRIERFQADEIIYVVDARQRDHFEQLFLTARKWFQAKGRPAPEFKHISFGTVQAPGGKAIKTRAGESVKLRELLDEATRRALAIVSEKNPELPDEERREVARAIGCGAVRYGDLMQNRSLDYVFNWEKMLSLEGNTAPYLLYAAARIHGIFRKAGLRPGAAEDHPSPLETETETALARKLLGFANALNQTLADLRPHFLCTYLYELAGAFSSFYNADRVIVGDPGARARRLILCARTLLILETGLRLLGLRVLQRI